MTPPSNNNNHDSNENNNSNTTNNNNINNNNNSEDMISSGSWSHPKHRLGGNVSSMSSLTAQINCANNYATVSSNVARATPTSSDQITGYEHAKDDCTIREVTPLILDQDKEVIVDNEVDECSRKFAQRNRTKLDEKNR